MILNRILKSIFLLFLLIFISSCNKNSSSTNRVGVLNDSLKLHQIDNWRIYGAFIEKPEDSIYPSLLSKPYFNENSLSRIQTIQELDEIITKETEHISMINHTIKKDIIDIEKISGISEKLLADKLFCVYLSCKVESEIDQEVALLTGSTGGIKCWINGVEVINKDVRRELQKYQDFTKIRLKKGSNIIVVKLDSKRYWNWRFYALLGGSHISQKKHFESFSSYFLSDIMYNIGDSLKIKLPLAKGKVKVIINSKYPSNNVYEEYIDLEKEYKISIKNNWNGYYTCIVKSESYTYKQIFFVGNYMQELDKLRSFIQDSVNHNDTIINLNISPLIKRIEHLLNYKPLSDKQYFPQYLKIKNHKLKVLAKVENEWIKLIDYNKGFTNQIKNYNIDKSTHEIKIVFMGNSYDLNNNLDKLIFKDIKNNSIYPKNINNKDNKSLTTVYDTLSKNISIPKSKEKIIVFSFNKDIKSIKVKFKKEYESYIDVLFWHKKFLFVMDEFKGLTYNISNMTDYNNSGIHLKEFISNIDGTPQNYTLIIPENCKKNKKLPLVILPPEIGFISPYLHSIQVADHLKNEYLQNLSTKYQMAIIRLGIRNNGSYNIQPIAMSDFFQSIEDVKKYINIDEERLFLWGSCLGGQTCLQLATRFPSKFAALGLIFPITRHNDRFSEKKWVNANQPLRHIENLYNMPIKLVHSVDDEHTNVNSSILFNDIAKKNNLNLTTTFLKKITSYDTYDYYNLFEPFFKFFNKISNHTNPNKVIFSTSQIKYNKSYWVEIKEINPYKKASVTAEFNKEKQELVFSSSNVLKIAFKLSEIKDYKNGVISIYENKKLRYHGKPKNKIFELNTSIFNPKEDNTIITKSNKEGPVVDFFSESFIVVKGASGKQKDYKMNSIIANQFNDYWYKKYFVKCDIIDDININNEYLDYNLLLIGTQENNKILEKIYEKLPIKILRNGVKIKQKLYSGNSNFVMLFPNPLNPQKYILWIGTNNIDIFALKEDSLSKNGWYDFAVWDSSGIKETGFFNYQWQ